MIPSIYATDDQPLEEKLIYEHFFIFTCDWYIAEYDKDDTFFGYAILHNDYRNAEWGYASYQELKAINVRGIEVDRRIARWFDRH